MPTTTASANSGLLPSATAWPIARISTAISRPWRAIQTLCQVSITTATPRMAALNSSWPMPSNSCDNAPANAATRHAAATPASTPPPIQRKRCATEPVTASTMPTIRPASNTSRKTMMSAASNDGVLLHVQRTARLLVEVVVELVAARLQRPHIDHALALRSDDLFHPQRLAFKLHRLGVEILNSEYHRLVGRRAHLARLKRAVRIAQLNFRGLLREHWRRMQKRGRTNGGQGQADRHQHRVRHRRSFEAIEIKIPRQISTAHAGAGIPKD